MLSKRIVDLGVKSTLHVDRFSRHSFAKKLQNFNFRSHSSQIESLGKDDEFAYPVYTSADGDHSFQWHGALIHRNVCNLNSADFLPTKTVLQRSSNVVLLKAEHKDLGDVTFAAIQSEKCRSWKFCSIAIFGDDFVNTNIQRDAECEKIQVCIEKFCNNLNLKSVDANSLLDNFTDSFLLGNIPYDAGHWQEPISYMKTPAEIMQSVVDSEMEWQSIMKALSPEENEIESKPNSSDISEHSNSLKVISFEDKTNMKSNLAKLLNPYGTNKHTNVDNLNTSCSYRHSKIVLLSPSSAWVAIDLDLHSDSYEPNDGCEEVNILQHPRVTSTKLLCLLINTMIDGDITGKDAFVWKISNVLCIDN